MISHRASFARTLPILAFLLSYVLIVIPATMAYVNLKQASRHGNDVIVRSHKQQLTVPHDHFLSTSAEAGAVAMSYTIQAINLPGSFIAAPLDALTKNLHLGWLHAHPLTWRAIAFPIFCLPFWWFAGLGLDALLTRRWIRAWTGFAGSFLCLFYLFFFVCMAIGLPSLEPLRTNSALCGLALWTLFLTAFPVTSVRQWVILRRIRASLHARLTAATQ